MTGYENLFTKLALDGLTPTKDWSAAADFLSLLVDYCLQAKPSIIVECSSGISTIVLARCCQINDHGKIISLENGTAFAEKTRQNLQHFALDNYAQVLDAPLTDITLEDKTYLWYQSSGNLPDNIELLVIDGPPGFIQKHSRYPALPMLNPFFADNCRVFLDDAARDDELDIVKRWAAIYQPTVNNYIKTERGCAVMDFSKKPESRSIVL